MTEPRPVARELDPLERAIVFAIQEAIRLRKEREAAEQQRRMAPVEKPAA